MALPQDNPDAVTAAVKAEINKMGPKELAGLPDLDGRDLQLIGTLIQFFFLYGSKSSPCTGVFPCGKDAAQRIRETVAKQSP